MIQAFQLTIFCIKKMDNKNKAQAYFRFYFILNCSKMAFLNNEFGDASASSSSVLLVVGVAEMVQGKGSNIVGHGRIG